MSDRSIWASHDGELQGMVELICVDNSCDDVSSGMRASRAKQTNPAAAKNNLT